MVTFTEVSESSFCTYLVDLYKLDQKYFPNPWNIKEWSSLFLSNSEYKIFTLIEDDIVIGFTLFGLDGIDNFGHLLKICLNEQYCSQGHGSRLLRRSISQLAVMRVDRIYLEVAVSNTRAIKLYKNFLFETLCVKKRFYSDGTDAYAMQRLNE